VTHYFRIWTRDAKGNFSTLSNAATAVAQLTILSISVDVSLYQFGAFTSTSSTISASVIIVTNDGNVSESYFLKAATNTPGTRWRLGDAPGSDVVALKALFNVARPQDSDFESVISTLSITDTLSGNAGGPFSGDQTGSGVPIQIPRNLWFKLGMPSS